MFIDDHLSRAYLNEEREILIPDLQVNEIHLKSYLPVAPEIYRQFEKETALDGELQLLQDVVHKGWPSDQSRLPPSLRPYWNFRDEISSINGLLYKSNKIVVPKSLKDDMLNRIHESHLGIVKCKERARDVLFWLGMSQDVEDEVRSCEKCALNQNKNAKKPMQMVEMPDRP